MSAEPGNVQPWREAEILIRESLLDGTVGGDLSEVRYNRAIMALTALTTQIEELSRERDAVRFCAYCATGFIPNPGDEHKDSCPGCTRAEKAGRALGEIDAWAGRMPDAGFTDADPRWNWWMERPRL